MDKFKEVGGKLQNDCAELAKGMMRNFCVLTNEAKYNATKESWTNDYINHRVLVGSQEKIDGCL